MISLIKQCKKLGIDIVDLQFDENVVTVAFSKHSYAWLTKMPSELFNETNIALMIADAHDRFNKATLYGDTGGSPQFDIEGEDV